MSEFMPTTNTPSRIDVSLQKPTTITSIEATTQLDNLDPETKRLRVKEDCAAALRILSNRDYDHFTVSLLFHTIVIDDRRRPLITLRAFRVDMSLAVIR